MAKRDKALQRAADWLSDRAIRALLWCLMRVPYDRRIPLAGWLMAHVLAPVAGYRHRIRQNLALVVGLQGRFEEATTLAQQDLPAEQVQENMAYLKKMLSQPNTWQQISSGASQG